MKKIFLVLALAMFGASCVQNFNEVSVAADSSVQGGLTQEQRAKKIVIDMLHRVDPQTRGYVRQIASVDFISYEQLMGSRTRTESDSTDTDGLKFNPNPIRNDGFHLINFADSTGYAIVGQIRDDLEMFDPDADDDSGAVGLLAMTDSGSITTEEILSYGDEWTSVGGSGNNNGNSSASTDVSNAESEFLNAILTSYINRKYTHDGYSTETTLQGGVSSWSVGPLLLTTHWTQYMPFNALIHGAGGEDHRVAGCTTIAVAQVLTYLKDKDLSLFGLPESATWEKIESVNPNDTDASEDESIWTAQLVKSIADGMDVKYNYNGRGGTMATAKMAKEYLCSLGYDAHKYLGYTSNDEDRVIGSINNGKPVIMVAVYSTLVFYEIGGHSWVIDGYIRDMNKHSYYVHCNFGWGGHSNG